MKESEIKVETVIEDNFFETFWKLLEENVEVIKATYEKLLKEMPNNYLNELYQNYYLFKYRYNAFVYFIYNKYTDLIKIGCSNDPFHRLNQLNSMFKTNFGVNDALTLLGFKYIPSGKMLDAEKTYHNKYSKYRKYGEWFDISKDIITKECLLGDIIYDKHIKIDYDTDGILENEGFKNIKFKEVDDIYIYRFTAECISEEILKGKLSDHDIFVTKNKLFDFIDDKIKFTRPKILLEKIFRSPSLNIDNQTWEMFQWLYINRDKYKLTTIPRYDWDTEKTKCKVIALGDAEKCIYYNDTLTDIINEYIGFGTSSLMEVQA